MFSILYGHGRVPLSTVIRVWPNVLSSVPASAPAIVTERGGKNNSIKLELRPPQAKRNRLKRKHSYLHFTHGAIAASVPAGRILAAAISHTVTLSRTEFGNGLAVH